MKTICISVNDQGQFSVGTQPAAASGPEVGAAETGTPAPAKQVPVGGEPPEDDGAKPYMQPAKSLEDALAQAKQMLEQPETQDGGPSPFEQGFAQSQGNPDMGSTATGMGM
jgi:hypothetical protein